MEFSERHDDPGVVHDINASTDGRRERLSALSAPSEATSTSQHVSFPKAVLRQQNAVSNRREMRARGNGLGLRSPHAIIGIACAAAILFGLVSRDQRNLTASDGLGYVLGIVGLSMMVLLLGYSIRKRARALRNAGPIRTWFEWHLMLGLLGPTAILYHSNFEWGSTNASISLACVLAVSGSGVGGRFLYGRMHRSLAGSRRSVRGMQQQAHEALAPIASVLDATPESRRLISGFEAFAIDGASSLFRSLRALSLRPMAWRMRKRLVRTIRASASSPAESARVESAVSDYLAHVCRAGELRLFEQLFALWHAIHVPLTFILFVSAALHIVAVHLY